MSRVVVGRRAVMSLISLLLNLLWIVCGGLWMALGWVIAAVTKAARARCADPAPTGTAFGAWSVFFRHELHSL